MLAKLNTFSLLGIDALPVEVEVDVSAGALPKTLLVGLPAGILAAWRYHQQGFVDWRVATFLFCGFVIGGYCGAQLAVGVSEKALRQLFALSMVALGVRIRAPSPS